MPTITFTWDTQGVNSCQKCLALSGYTWQFTDDMPTVLVHPQYGVVYDVGMDEPRTHGQGVHNCHCKLTTEIDDSDIQANLAAIDSYTDSMSNSLYLSNSEIQQFLTLLKGIT